MSNFNAPARAAKGCALLDEKAGSGWVKKIDVEMLDVISFCECPVSQVFGNFDDGLVELGIPADATYASAVSFGFHPTISGTEKDQELEGVALTEAFIVEVNKRLAA
jgi:hypothetical protein